MMAVAHLPKKILIVMATVQRLKTATVIAVDRLLLMSAAYVVAMVHHVMMEAIALLMFAFRLMITVMEL